MWFILQITIILDMKVSEFLQKKIMRQKKCGKKINVGEIPVGGIEGLN